MPAKTQPLGHAEIAVILDVQVRTVHQWRFRRGLPERRWTVHGLPTWDLSDIIGWAVATDRLAPEEVDAAIERYAEYQDEMLAKARANDDA